MKPLTPICLAVMLFVPAMLQANTLQPFATPTEPVLECFCIRLVGADPKHWGRMWGELRPFVLDADGLTIVCSAGCEGDAALRGGYRVVATGPNYPKGSPRWQRRANVVDTVILYKDKRRILTLNRNEDDASSVFIATNRKELLTRLPASR